MSRRTPFALVAALVAALFAVALAGLPGAAADPRLGQISIVYDIDIAGAPVAELTLDIQVNESSYSIAGRGGTVGLVDLISRIRFSGNSSGVIDDHAVRPRAHSYSFTERGKTRDVSLTYDEAMMPAVVVRPEFTPSYERVPLPVEKMAGTIDLASQFLTPAAPGLGLLAPGQCARQFAVFDGRLRVDASVRHVKSAPSASLRGVNYKGPLMHCAMTIRPIGGHKEGDMLSKVAEKGEIDVWVAPALGGKVYIPVRVRIPTPVGTAELASRVMRVTPVAQAGLGG